MNHSQSSDRKPAVLFLNSCVSGGGAGRSLLAYLDLCETTFDVHIVAPRAGQFERKLRRGETLHIIPEFLERLLILPSRLLSNVPVVNAIGGMACLMVAALKICFITRKCKAQVIYCNHMIANPIGLLVGLIMAKPVIFHIRNIHNSLPIERWIYRAMARPRIVKALICNSQASAGPFIDIVPDKISVVHNFCDLRSFDLNTVAPALRKELGIGPATPVIGYAGRVVRWKGIDLLLDSFAKVLRSRSDAKLVILGDNDPGARHNLREAYRQYAQELGIGDSVHFIGYREDVRPYICDFDVLALPSRSPEPFGRVLIEAMALGVPSVIAAHGGAVEVVAAGHDGIWAAPLDSDDMAEKLLLVLNDDAMRKNMSIAAMVSAHTKFNGDKLVGRIYQCIQGLVGGVDSQNRGVPHGATASTSPDMRVHTTAVR